MTSCRKRGHTDDSSYPQRAWMRCGQGTTSPALASHFQEAHAGEHPDKGTPGETQGRKAAGPRCAPPECPQDRRAAEGLHAHCQESRNVRTRDLVTCISLPLVLLMVAASPAATVGEDSALSEHIECAFDLLDRQQNEEAVRAFRKADRMAGGTSTHRSAKRLADVAASSGSIWRMTAGWSTLRADGPSPTDAPTLSEHRMSRPRGSNG